MTHAVPTRRSSELRPFPARIPEPARRDRAVQPAGATAYGRHRRYSGGAGADTARRPQGDAGPDGRGARLAGPGRLRPRLWRKAAEAGGAEICPGPARRPDPEEIGRAHV